MATAVERRQVGHVFEDVPLTSAHWKAGFALFFAFVIEARLDRDDAIRLVTGTPGGWGPPANQARALIEADLRDGYITPTQATRDHGPT